MRFSFYFIIVFCVIVVYDYHHIRRISNEFSKNDIDGATRIKIGLNAYFHKGVYGHITYLARYYSVSCWFIYYSCLSLVEGMVSEFEGGASTSYFEPLTCQVSSIEDAALTLYLDCESSLSGIQRAISDFFGRHVSIGQVSGILNNIGSRLSDTDSISSVRLCLISDEIFGNGQPILATVDSESFYLVQLRKVSQRDKETWGLCRLEIVGDDGQVERIAADMGTGLVGGISLVFPEAVYQADLLHVLMPLASLVWQFERKACSAIKAEYESLDKSESSKYGKTRAKHEALYVAKSDKAINLIDRYDDYHYLFRELQQALQIIDEQKGELRSKADVKGEIEAILDLMETIDNEKLKDRARKFRAHLDDLLRYFDQVAVADQRLKDGIPDEAVRRELIRLYALEKAFRSATGNHRKQLKADIECLKEILGEWLSSTRFKQLYKRVGKELSAVIRSSSMVENINSRLRRFFDVSRGQISQNRLNLIRFYLNRKLFARGPRKGASPKQMFYGEEKNAHWLTELKAAINQ